MITTYRNLLIATTVWLGCLRADPAGVKIIANASVTASDISPEELRHIFLIVKNSLSDGSRVEPVIEKGGAAHEAFLRDVLGKTDVTLNTYYRSLVFTGKGTMPKILSGDAEVERYVARTRGAIGYISAECSPAGVKVLRVR